MKKGRTTRYPLLKPRLPTAEKLLPYLRRIDQNGWYTNHGPMLQEFEARLADHFHLEGDQLATCANATLAIAQTLKAVGAAEGSLCVMPSWTFVATPAAAKWASLKPYFMDVDPETWLISPQSIRELARTREIGAVVVVSAFGAPVDMQPWEELTRDTGIPVVIDAASGFDSFTRYGHWDTKIPVVISMHATKVSGIGEGALVLCSDAVLAKRIAAYGNFGFAGGRHAVVAGANTKMSEYVAATGLAFMAEWPARRKEWAQLTAWFAAELAATPDMKPAPGFGGGWISSYGLVELQGDLSSDEVQERLHEEGIESRHWWAKGCHTQPAYKTCTRGNLEQTERLSDTVLGLPFWRGMTQSDVTDIFQTLRKVINSKASVASKNDLLERAIPN